MILSCYLHLFPLLLFRYKRYSRLFIFFLILSISTLVFLHLLEALDLSEVVFP